ncbi:hypothetical protein [Brevundimonas sp.]|uniref:hypothetical protein n=1 Tax=Brevundimonas sp. TaxID=1871086 RepID=UPI002899E636|nr:hypothetical protein [Brevundimonas sp.]
MARMKAAAIKSKDITLRDTYWPDAEDRLWDRSKMDGYATVPKTLPLLMRAMDELSKGKPLGATYFALWCSTWDNAFVRLGRATDLPYASGFTGARGVRIWQERMKLLESYGFVELRPSGEHKLGLAFLPNPNLVLLNLWHNRDKAGVDPTVPEGVKGLQEATFTAFFERALDVGAHDVVSEHARRLKAAAPPKAAKPAKSTRPKPRAKSADLLD